MTIHQCCSASPKRKWMNPKPKGKEPYSPTLLEHWANIFTHASAIVPSIIAACYMISYTKSHVQYKTALIYGISLIMLFTVSTLFHTFSCIKKFRHSGWRTFFHYCDRATIYLFIASNYTPWLYLRTTNHLLGEYMIVIVWLGALSGVVYQIVFHEKYKILEIVFYMVVGICPSISVIGMNDVSGLTELAIGGAFYITGIVFFKSDGVIPFAHSIWHCFVVMGACVHYYAVFTYLFKEEHLAK